MTDELTLDRETDDRFPSGPWIGFFLQKEIPGRHWMALDITFQAGKIDGIGSDWVGKFHLTGRYQLDDGQCFLSKRYLARHDVAYTGYNEGRGIWGTWKIAGYSTGGFHIWPKGMPDPTGSSLDAQEEIPLTLEPVLVDDEAVIVRPGQ